MTLYSKNGSIPKPETDGTEGWIEVPKPPVPPTGMETVWWYPPGWVVRPVCPGPDWSWSQSQGEWTLAVKSEPEPEPEPAPEPAPAPAPWGNVSI